MNHSEALQKEFLESIEPAKPNDMIQAMCIIQDLRQKLSDTEKEYRECFKARLDHIGTISSLEAQVELLESQLKEANQILWFYGTQCKWSVADQFTYEHRGPWPDYRGGEPAMDYIRKFKVDYENTMPILNKYKAQ